MPIAGCTIQRVRLLSAAKSPTTGSGGVVYWMSRDQRAQDNWALIHAQGLAQETAPKLACLLPFPLLLTLRLLLFPLILPRHVHEALEIRMLQH